MAILCSMPGRHGDILWALATMRSIALAADEPTDLLISGKYCSLAPLLRTQPYIRQVVVTEDWVIEESAPMTPRMPPDVAFAQWYETPAVQRYGSQVRHIPLGYKAWPSAPLPQYIYETTRAKHPDLAMAPLDLETPWITSPPDTHPPNLGGSEPHLATGFSDEYFECKVGVVELFLLAQPFKGTRGVYIMAAPESRWAREYVAPGPVISWIEAAIILASAAGFLGCNSALHVLACAVGVPKVVLLEPNPQRHHDHFYPYGKAGGRVTLVLGGDGLPTFDARHCIETVKAVLA